MTDHHRKRERKEINQTIPIFDIINNREVGELVNITVDGMMIISGSHIETQSIFQFLLKLPGLIQGVDELHIGVDCLWCRETENFHRYWAGFQIIDASDETVAIIETLIKNYGGE